MFKRVGQFVGKHPKKWLALWILILIGSFLVSPKLHDRLAIGGSENQKTESTEARAYIQEHYDGLYKFRALVIVSNPSMDVDDPAFKDAVTRIETEAKRIGEVERIISPFNADRPQLLDAANHRAFMYLDMNQNAVQYVGKLRSKIEELKDPLQGFQVLVSGGPGVSYDVNQTSASNVATVEKIGLPIVFILLLVVFRSVIAALLPLLMGIFSILVSMAVIYFVSLNVQLSTLLNNIVTMLGLGVAIDYALFITQRFREEMRKHGDKHVAIAMAVSTSGKSVFFAGMTVAISLISLISANTLITRSVAIGGFVVVLVSLFASLTLLPAVLVLLGKNIDFLRIPFAPKTVGNNRIAGFLIQRFLKYPIMFLLIGLLLASAFLPFVKDIQVHSSVVAYQELPDGSDSKEGMKAVVDHFGVGELFPIQVVLQSPDRNVYSAESLSEIDRLTQKIKEVAHVSRVVSLTTLSPQTADPAAYAAIYQNRDSLPAAMKSQLKNLVGKDMHSTVLQVISANDPNSDESRAIVKELRQRILPEANLSFIGKVTGDTAVGVDVEERITSSIPMILGIVVGLTFLLLFSAFRSIILPLKAILLNGLVTASSLGFLVYMFQEAHLHGTTPMPLDINTPVILFTLLFGLSVDYEVILVSRMKEMYDSNKNIRTSITDGFISTVGMINGAASIMIVVFTVFYFADFQIIRQLGVGLAFAILVDVLLVRTLLVPTTMFLLGPLNWWLPNQRRRQKKSKELIAHELK
ncbi:MMPL family transporter [Paenibacillus rhizophilus]|uniref:MMPL family transporter n=1 Tax=Paenibacillus rhizophilus TaxID=1850366 RepID=A0A3N9PTF1_9BACL|nr:MMPL family transporter [Paenibacillus rhizophilus]RQW09672.1 MMPL family transporter [Paenibacillus rhizophilus]